MNFLETSIIQNGADIKDVVLLGDIFNSWVLHGPADRLCQRNDYHVVVFGHTHNALIDKDFFLVKDRIYANSGCFCKENAYCVEDLEAEFYTAERCSIIELSNTPDDPEVSLARVRVAPGVATRWHRLIGTAERYVILDGSGSMEVAGLSPREVSAGDVVLIPPDAASVSPTSAPPTCCLSPSARRVSGKRLTKTLNRGAFRPFPAIPAVLRITCWRRRPMVLCVATGRRDRASASVQPSSGSALM